MNPGSTQAAIVWATNEARDRGHTGLAGELEKASNAISGLVDRSHALLESAVRNSDGSDTYCVPVSVMDDFSTAVALVGGAA